MAPVNAEVLEELECPQTTALWKVRGAEALSGFKNLAPIRLRTLVAAAKMRLQSDSYSIAAPEAIGNHITVSAVGSRTRFPSTCHIPPSLWWCLDPCDLDTAGTPTTWITQVATPTTTASPPPITETPEVQEVQVRENKNLCYSTIYWKTKQSTCLIVKIKMVPKSSLLQRLRERNNPF